MKIGADAEIHILIRGEDSMLREDVTREPAGPYETPVQARS
jgi:hypothetical protein